MKLIDIVTFLKKIGIIKYNAGSYDTSKGDKFDPLFGEYNNIKGEEVKKSKKESVENKSKKK